MGSVAVVYFEITGAGSGSFATQTYVDDIASYIACESVHGTTKVTQDTWGSVKALYE